MPLSNTKVDLKKLPRTKVSRLKRQAKHLGMSADDYALQLIEDGLELNAEALNTPWDTLVEPFQKAFGDLSEQELDALVEKARRSQHKKK
jgi:hypothetical protein